MSLATVRGGTPKVFRAVVTSPGISTFHFRCPTNYLMIRSDQPMRMYFSADDATNDANYVVVPAATPSTPYGSWQGPADLQDIWLLAESADANAEIVGFMRLG